MQMKKVERAVGQARGPASARLWAGSAAACALLCWGVALGAGCATTLEQFEPGALVAPSFAALPPPADDEPARRLLDEDIVRFDVDDADEVVVDQWQHTQTRIFNSEGQRWRGATLFWDRTFTAIRDFRVRTWAPDGATMLVGRDKLVDVPDLGTYYLYSDQRRALLPVPEVKAGSVVDVAQVVRTRSPTLFTFGHVFGDGIGVDVSRFVVDVPAGFDIDVYAEEGGARIDWAPVESATAHGRRLVWERTGIAPVERGDDAPPLSDIVRRVSVRLRRAHNRAGVVVEGPADARALSRYTHEVTASRAPVTPRIQAIVKTVLGDDPHALPPRERAARLYAWTRDSIRYCSIQIGMGGWVPHEADKTEELRYGDCKDKANLLKALLRAVDVDSRLVTIHAGRAASPFRLPVLAGNFNHAILSVDFDDGSVLADPTTRTVAFGDLPPSDEARVCLPADPQGSALVQTPSSSPDTDQRTARYRLSAGADGRVTGVVDVDYGGSFADDVRELLLDVAPQEAKKALVRGVGADSAVVDAFTVEGAAAPVHPTPVTVHAQVHDDLSAGGRLAAIFSASVLLVPDVPELPLSRPAVDVVFGVRARVVDDIVLAVPGDTRVVQLPPPAHGETPHWAWSLAWTTENGALHLVRTVEQRAERVPYAAVGALRAEVQHFLRAHEAHVILAPSSSVPATSPSPSPSPSSPSPSPSSVPATSTSTATSSTTTPAQEKP